MCDFDKSNMTNRSYSIHHFSREYKIITDTEIVKSILNYYNIIENYKSLIILENDDERQEIPYLKVYGCYDEVPYNDFLLDVLISIPSMDF